MVKTTLILIRHGYSEANEGGFIAGFLDVHLTALGVRQAELTAEVLSDYAIDRLYSSDLLRAVETAAPLARVKGLSIIRKSGLREIDTGDWTGRTFDELSAEYPEDFRIWREELGRFRCPGGESIAQLSRRVVRTLEVIIAEKSGKTVCVVTHATPIRVLQAHWLGKDVAYASRLSYVGNSSVTVVEHEDGAYRVRRLGDTEHLEQYKTPWRDV